MEKILDNLSLIAVLIAVIFLNFTNDLEPVLIGFFIITLIQLSLKKVFSLKTVQLLRTRYDLFFQISYISFGLICLICAVLFWHELNSYKWVLLIFSSIGLIKGSFYENSIHIRNSNQGLLVEHNRATNLIQIPDSIILYNNKLVIREKERIIEINDIKDSPKNREKIIWFFKTYYPELTVDKLDLAI